MLFVGYGCSRSYEVDKYPGSKEDVYFLDDGKFYDEAVIFGNDNLQPYPCSDNGRWSAEGHVQRFSLDVARPIDVLCSGVASPLMWRQSEVVAGFNVQSQTVVEIRIFLCFLERKAAATEQASSSSPAGGRRGFQNRRKFDSTTAPNAFLPIRHRNHPATPPPQPPPALLAPTPFPMAAPPRPRRSWAGLPAAPLLNILRRIPCPEDRHRAFVAFRSRRAAAADLTPRKLPWLLLPTPNPDGSPRAGGCALSGCGVHHHVTFAPRGARFFGTHDGGWLFVHFRQRRSHQLANLRTGRVRELPAVLLPRTDDQVIHDMVILAAALSCWPDYAGCVAVAIVTASAPGALAAAPPRRRCVAFWRMGWPRAYEIAPPGAVAALDAEDVAYHDRAFHLLLTQGDHIEIRECATDSYQQKRIRIKLKSQFATAFSSSSTSPISAAATPQPHPSLRPRPAPTPSRDAMAAPPPPPPPLESLPDDILHLILTRIPCSMYRGLISRVRCAWRDLVRHHRAPPPLPWLLPDGSTRVACLLGGHSVHHYLTIIPPGARLFGSHDGAWIFIHCCDREQPRGNHALNVVPGTSSASRTVSWAEGNAITWSFSSPRSHPCRMTRAASRRHRRRTLPVGPSPGVAALLSGARGGSWHASLCHLSTTSKPRTSSTVYHDGAFHMLSKLDYHIRVCKPTVDCLSLNWETRRFQFQPCGASTSSLSAPATWPRRVPRGAALGPEVYDGTWGARVFSSADGARVVLGMVPCAGMPEIRVFVFFRYYSSSAKRENQRRALILSDMLWVREQREALDMGPASMVEDVVYHGDAFHFLTDDDNICVATPVQDQDGSLDVQRDARLFHPGGHGYEQFVHARFLVMSPGELLMVVKFKPHPKEPWTSAFKVFLATERQKSDGDTMFPVAEYPWSWSELDMHAGWPDAVRGARLLQMLRGEVVPGLEGRHLLLG
ncbi:hypothetical protein BAE44_0005325 [Dichanthelium oligosanthes]|uniref:KIB1-4 beta-propeller domain-containing protein n=1 Tax=Dichanthelium oligosanthes TaxID=888268 RepID=A0A1E5W8B6_9POAL|nr:hypothetical protein BAE44_0005325 [Dichanthelium oligosanthes]